MISNVLWHCFVFHYGSLRTRYRYIHFFELLLIILLLLADLTTNDWLKYDYASITETLEESTPIFRCVPSITIVLLSWFVNSYIKKERGVNSLKYVTEIYSKRKTFNRAIKTPKYENNLKFLLIIEIVRYFFPPIKKTYRCIYLSLAYTSNMKNRLNRYGS